MLHTHPSQSYEVCHCLDQAAHYHILGPKLGASCLTWHVAGFGAQVVFSTYKHLADISILVMAVCF
jgi:hypothetical protein